MSGEGVIAARPVLTPELRPVQAIGANRSDGWRVMLVVDAPGGTVNRVLTAAEARTLAGELEVLANAVEHPGQFW